MNIRVIKDMCTGCRLCVKACPFGAIAIHDHKAVIDLVKCTLCGACVTTCKFGAIEMTVPAVCQPAVNLADYKGVWVFCEQKKGQIQSISYELLGKGRGLADKLGTYLAGVLLGDKISDKANELVYRGADRVYLVESERLAHYQPQPYTNVLIDLIERHKPEILLCGATSIGRSLVSRVAVKYAKERVQFGKPISSFQAIQHILANMATEIEAARALVYATARLIDSGATKVSKASAMAKLFASDVAMRVTTDAVQVFGGYGYMRDYPIEKFMRDAKITQIYEGTNQIQRNVIALELIKESLIQREFPVCKGGGESNFPVSSVFVM